MVVNMSVLHSVSFYFSSYRRARGETWEAVQRR